MIDEFGGYPQDYFRRVRQGRYIFLGNCLWRKLGISMVWSRLHGETAEHWLQRRREGIEIHNKVAKFIVNHSSDTGFEEKYFNKDGELRYFHVLNLAEEELKEVA